MNTVNHFLLITKFIKKMSSYRKMQRTCWYQFCTCWLHRNSIREMYKFY